MTALKSQSTDRQPWAIDAHDFLYRYTTKEEARLARSSGDHSPPYYKPRDLDRVNPILVEFRRSFPSDVAEAARIEAEWCTQPNARPVPVDATAEQIDHARRVFERIARICGSSR